LFTPGQLIYFDPFHFKNGAASKPKYFLVLKIVQNNVILACLPSSVNHLPQNQVVVHGCLEIQEACITCYVFKKNRPITKTGWAFPLDTMLYGNWLDDFEMQTLISNYPMRVSIMK
jgi:hypothetical protein